MLMHIGTNPIETERLLLRKFSFDDCSDMLKYWASDERVQKSYGEPVYSTEAEVTGLLEKYIGGYEKRDFYRWAIEERSSGRCIGQIAFFLVDSRNSFAEIEYCIGAGYQCRGYATEAAKAVIQYGFEQAGFHKLQICHRSNNLPSKRVIEKCGFVFEGALRDYFLIDERFYDRLYYSILENEYIQSVKGGKQDVNT